MFENFEIKIKSKFEWSLSIFMNIKIYIKGKKKALTKLVSS